MNDAAASVDLDDMQGLLRFGYARHTESCFLLLAIADREAARHWLAAAPVASAVTLAAPPPQNPLVRLNVPPAEVVPATD